MTDIPMIFSQKRLLLKKKRIAKTYSDYDFFHQALLEDTFERLRFLNRDFSDIAFIDCPSFTLQKAGSQEFFKEKKTETIYHIGRYREIHPISDNLSFIENEFIPLAPKTMDAVIAPLSLHNMNDILGMFIQIEQSLKPDGIFIAHFMGDNLIQQLRKIFAEVELTITNQYHPRIHPVIAIKEVGNLLSRAGFSLPVADSSIFPVSYKNIMSLFYDLRFMGETNILCDGHSPLRRDVLHSIVRELQALYQKSNGKYHFDVDIITITGRSPSEAQQKPLKRGSAKTHLSRILGDKTPLA